MAVSATHLGVIMGRNDRSLGRVHRGPGNIDGPFMQLFPDIDSPIENGSGMAPAIIFRHRGASDCTSCEIWIIGVLGTGGLSKVAIIKSVSGLYCCGIAEHAQNTEMIPKLRKHASVITFPVFLHISECNIAHCLCYR